MTPAELATTVKQAATRVLEAHDLDASVVPDTVTVERPRNPEHGDYATNIALQVAKKAGTNPRELAGWLAEYDRGAAEFDRVIADAESLDELIPQPTAPWQPEREWLSIRAMIIHLIRETAHHCGHADIIREALDGQTTMGAISEGQEWAEQWADADWAK